MCVISSNETAGMETGEILNSLAVHSLSLFLSLLGGTRQLRNVGERKDQALVKEEGEHGS